MTKHKHQDIRPHDISDDRKHKQCAENDDIKNEKDN